MSQSISQSDRQFVAWLADLHPELLNEALNFNQALVRLKGDFIEDAARDALPEETREKLPPSKMDLAADAIEDESKGPSKMRRLFNHYWGDLHQAMESDG